MTRLYPTLGLAAVLCLAGPPLAAQVHQPNPFAVEGAERDVAGRHPRHERDRRHDSWRLERRGQRLERQGDRIERKGRRWERHGERLQRRGHQYRGRKWERKGERLQHRGDRLEHRGERFERRERHSERSRVRRHGHHGEGST